MRIHALIAVLSLAALPATGAAQGTAPAPQPTGVAAPVAAAVEDESAWPTTTGRVDFGARYTDIDGRDASRYERYRDMGNGLFLDAFRFDTERRGWVLQALSNNLGRRDQMFAGSAIKPGRVKFWASWDQIPMLLSRSTETLFTETSPGVLELDNTLQATVQAQANATAQAGVLAAAVPGARRFTLDSRRHIFEGGVQYISHTGLTLSSNVRRMNRDGAIPFGGAFGHGNVVETLAPVKHQLTDVNTIAEYAEGNLLVRGGTTGSWFHNEVTTLTFDNPWRVTDISTAGSRGRASLPPSNSLMGVNAMVSYRLPYRTRATAFASLGSLRDAGDPLMPFTVNTALPTIALNRVETEGHARTKSLNLSFSSRPTRMLDVDMRFRSYDYDNLTPGFTSTQRVGYDNAVSATTARTEPFGLVRKTFDADVRLMPLHAVAAGVGFTHTSDERTYRIFEEIKENVMRVTADSVGSKWFTVRTKYEHAERRGEGDLATIAAELSSIGEQPGLRHFDIASRDRDRVTLIGSTTPFDFLSLSASVAAGKDDYFESEFGLRDNTHRVYSAGFDISPTEDITAGISYSLERYRALSRSRQASPGVQFTDPSRNWATNTLDHSESWIARVEFLRLLRKLDVTLMADLNHSRGTYNYITGAVADRTLPEEVVVPTTLPTPTQLPPTRSNLSRGSLDAIYNLGEHWGLGGSIWFEQYTVRDFSLDEQAISRIDLPGALLLGYRYYPYTARTFWGRAVYRF